MAIDVSLLTSSSTYSFSQTLDTASFTLGANELGLIAVVNMRDDVGSPPGTVTVTQTGVTWVEIANVLFHSIATPVLRLTLLRAMETGSHTSAATITVSGSQQAYWDYAVHLVTGCDTSGTSGSGAIVQSATNRVDTDASSLTVTLAALGDAVNNAVFACFGNDGGHTGAPDGGYTELYDGPHNVDPSLETQWLLPGTTTPGISSLFNDAIAGIAIEIKDAVAAGTNPKGPLGNPFHGPFGGPI